MSNNTTFDARRKSELPGMSEQSVLPQDESNIEADLKGLAQQNETNYTQNGVDKGERVKVAVRCRPMQPHELARNDGTCLECADNNNIILTMPGNNSKQYTFNAVMNEGVRQGEVFSMCSVHELI